jgi:putative tricarboxylic transport membrane protein
MTSTTTPRAGGAPAGGTALQLPARAGRHIGEYVVAALALGLGIFTFIGALSIRVPASGVQVGPRVFPYFVGTILIDLLGWPIAAAVLFGGVAWTLGAKKWWLALLIGLTLGLVVFIAFGGFLGLSLPSGPLLSFLDPILRMLRG